MRRLLPLTALRAFEAAARHLSFKAAAEELALTPTAISHQIRTLEARCGRALFRRRPRPLALTEAGAQLFPVISGGLDRFAAALAAIKGSADRQTLRVTTTNAFAGRWLVPRLPLWRTAHPAIAIEVIGTDAVADLRAGEADVAIRYALDAPAGLVAEELFRDRFWPICNPRLLADGKPVRHPGDLADYPLIHTGWPDTNAAAPTWRRWLAAAGVADPEAAAIDANGGLGFREESHAIEAVVAGHGIGICSDVLVGRELARGALIKAVDLALPGFGFYLAHLPNHPRQPSIDAFAAWMRSVR